MTIMPQLPGLPESLHNYCGLTTTFTMGTVLLPVSEALAFCTDRNTEYPGMPTPFALVISFDVYHQLLDRQAFAVFMSSLTVFPSSTQVLLDEI